LAAIAWALLVLAAARPQWSGEPLQIPVPGRDLMLAVDLSDSMQAQDFRLQGRIVDRLSAAKAVAGPFIRRRVGDRLGLILFGQNAYLQAPLTFDRATVESLLQESAIGLAGKKTAIGDAIGLAVKRLRDTPASSRVLILMTDGANTAGAVEPVKAAGLAARAGLRIHTIGIGADEMRVQSLLGVQRVSPSRHLDEATLRAIAERTGGQYFRAHDTAELERIYGLLDALEPLVKETQPFRPTVSLYPWPLGLALALCGALVLMRTARGGRS
jgi:Ca-activated chloride channel family protein